MVLFAIITILLLPTIVSAKDLYVNKYNLSGVSCSDSYTRAINDFSHPWCSILIANNLHNAGDTVYILPGEYREYIVPISGIDNEHRTVYSGYGNREDVKIIGSDVVSGWTNYNTNVYQTNFVAIRRCDTNYLAWLGTDCWEDRQRWFTPQQSLAEVNAPGESYYDGATIYIYPFSGSATSHLIECSARIVNPVDVYDNYWFTYSAENRRPRSNYDIQNLTIMHSQKYGIHMIGSATNVSILNNHIMYNSGCGYSFNNPAAIGKESADWPLPSIVIRGNKIHDQGSDDGYFGKESGGLEHDGTGIELYSVRDGVIENNEVYNTSFGVFIKSSGGDRLLSYVNYTIRNNTVHDSFRGIGFGRGGQYGLDYLSGSIVDNTIYETTGAGIYFTVSNNRVIVSQNTLYRTGGIQGDGPVDNYNNFSNNILNTIISRDDPNSFLGFVWGMNRTCYSNYNLFYGTRPYFGWVSEGDRWSGGTIYYDTFDSWKAGTGHDLNSIETDPLFINTSNLDFRLQNNSPAIDAGMIIPDYHCAQSDDTNPGQTNCKHWSGAAPDIGAFEYTVPQTPICTEPYNYHRCDCINSTELANTISGWNQGAITINQLITNIKIWKQNSNC